MLLDFNAYEITQHWYIVFRTILSIYVHHIREWADFLINLPLDCIRVL